MFTVADMEADLAGSSTSTPSQVQFELLSPSDIKNMPDPVWVLADIVHECSTVLLFGPSGKGKSFVALEMTAGITTGQSDVFDVLCTGVVVYVTAEGQYGMKNRITAWEEARGREMDDARTIFIPQAVQLADDEHIDGLIAQLQERCKDDKPKLIVFDTLARCAYGMDENSAKDMGAVVRNLDRVRDAFGSIVLLVHHSTKANDLVERGSGAIYGAVDSVFRVKPKSEGGVIDLENTKQKNGPEAPTMTLILESVGDSCVVNERKKLSDKNGKSSADVQVLEVGGDLTKAVFCSLL